MRTEFAGEAFTHDPEIARRAISAWVNNPNLKSDSKMTGDQIFFKDEGGSIFAESGRARGFLMQGYLELRQAVATTQLRRLVELFSAMGVESYFDCTEEDESGRAVTDEVRVK